jgi:SNF2 family DNA or RNA helicase
MVRRVRHEVLTQLPSRTDTRIPIEMTAEQMDEHDALNVPIAQILARAKRRPLTRAEFLRLMTLLTTQRIIANGLAQLRFEEVWPDLSRIERPTDSTLRGLASPKLTEVRELIGQLVLAQGRKVVVFSQWRRMLRLADWATRDLLSESAGSTASGSAARSTSTTWSANRGSSRESPTSWGPSRRSSPDSSTGRPTK